MNKSRTEKHLEGGAERRTGMLQAQRNVDSLVKLAERERAGEEIAGGQIKKTWFLYAKLKLPN